MRKRVWQGVVLLVLGFCATPAGAQTLSNLLACLPTNTGTMNAVMWFDSVSELPGGG